MVLIAILAYFLTQRYSGFENAIPVLAVLAVGAQRLLPLLQQIYSSWTSIRGGQASLADTIVLLDQPLPDFTNYSSPSDVPFNKNIVLKDLSFRYEEGRKEVLNRVNLTVEKGTRVGILGVSGSGNYLA